MNPSCNKVYVKLSDYIEDPQYKIEGVKDSPNEYVRKCSYCMKNYNYQKPKLYIKKDLSVGHCFHCDSVFLNRQLQESEVCTEVTRMIRFKGFNKKRDFSLPEFDATYYFESKDEDKKCIEYLHNRNPKLNYSDYGIKFRRGKVVIPFYLYGKVVYYQIRYLNPVGSMKYFNPVIPNKIPYILPTRPVGHKVVLVEGCFDAFAAEHLFPKDYAIIALLGKTVTEYQISLLRDFRVDDFTIYLDKTELSRNLVSKLKEVDDFSIAKYRIIGSDGTDPEEYLRKFL